MPIEKGSKVRATRDIFLVPGTNAPADQADSGKITLNVSKGTLGVVEEVVTEKLCLVVWGSKTESEFALIGNDCEPVSG